MYYLVGSYRLENATLTVEQTPVRVGGSLVSMTIITHHVTGKIRAANQQALHAQIGNLLSALAAGSVFQAGLYNDNGQATHHVMQSAATLDGIKLTQGPDFPEGSGAEYSVFRTVQFTLQAEIINPAISGLLSFSEAITTSGGTRPSIWHIPADERISAIRQRLPRVPYAIMQSGTAETRTNSFAWPPALGGIEADDIQRTVIGPECSMGKLATYRWQWTYTGTSLSSPALNPQDRR